MNPKRILLTGAGGFTGQHFLKSAAVLGYECFALSQSGNAPLANTVKVIECDLLDFAKINQVLKDIQPDYVVHLAAIPFVAHGSTEDIYRTNVVGTVNLLDAIAAQCPHILKVLVASSGNIYGNASNLPITEQAAFKPENDYAVSKCAMELAINIRFSLLPIVITRPFNYTGVGQEEHFLVPKIVKAFKVAQTHIELGNLDVARDFSDVRDLVSAYLGLLESDCHSEAFNICSGKSISLLSIIDSLNALAGYQMNVTVNPDFVRANEIKELFGSDEKLRALIGPYRKFCFDDTLAWMYTES